MKLFTLSLFALGAMLTSNTFAATGTGHAQAELTNPLTVVNNVTLNFGTIAIDPAAGAQTLAMNGSGIVVCPATYVCSGSSVYGRVTVTGSPDTLVSLSLSGSTATLSDGAGNSLIFDPYFNNETDSVINSPLSAVGVATIFVMGSIDFTGNEVAGTYSSSNAGGTGYTVTVNY
ncbi:MAG: DUF4402 domain-containing protein [Alphaproteobacteria bacterium]|nr:DUF4402 domain-containing protein [Alphaproteobacteria bacterium]MBN2780190.1 DUF4402 domain-containing protein [Alphaproteobacteria bacterium]